jgi:hypothetical protein
VTYYQFKDLGNGKCLDVGGQVNGSVVQQYTCNGTVNQQWAFRATGSGYFQLVVASSGRCMEVANASQSEQAFVQIEDCNSGYNQQWIKGASTVAGYTQLVARHSSKCLSPIDLGSVDRTREVQYSCSFSGFEQWSPS